MLKYLERSVDYAQAIYHVNLSKKSSDESKKEIAQKYLIAKLAEMKGLAQKVGQIISLTEVQKKNKIFQTLTAKEITVEIDEIFRMLYHYNFDAKKHLKTINKNGLSASLSQVHQATLRKSDKKVALKILHEHIEKYLSTDLNFLNLLLKPIGSFKKDFDLKSFREEINEQLKNELNFEKEAHSMEFFEKMNINFLKIPKVHKSLSNSRLLVMDWEDGDDFEYVLKNYSDSEKKELSEKLITLFFTTYLKHHVLHADPHTGNYRFLRGNGKIEILLYDFGSIKYFEKNQVEAFKFWLLGTKKDISAFDHFLKMGFSEEKLQFSSAEFLEMSKILLFPMITDRELKISDWKISENIEKTLGEKRLSLRYAGKGNLIYLMRSFQGLLTYLDALNQKVNWYKIIKPLM
jgi:predicted unusual protein kinase regulating ubiquinone biosynthesis (AarF/ABC1/UbiB family)